MVDTPAQNAFKDIVFRADPRDDIHRHAELGIALNITLAYIYIYLVWRQTLDISSLDLASHSPTPAIERAASAHHVFLQCRYAIHICHPLACLNS